MSPDPWRVAPRPASTGRRRATPAVGYVPPGWPVRVRPPGAPDWEQSASAFLFDCCPADLRGYAVLRRHPVVLARFAAQSVSAQVASCVASLGDCRATLAEFVAGPVLDAAVTALQEQEAALRRTLREVALVEEALRGTAFIRKL